MDYPQSNITRFIIIALLAAVLVGALIFAVDMAGDMVQWAH